MPALAGASAIQLAAGALPNHVFAQGTSVLGLAGRAEVSAVGNHESAYYLFVRSIFRPFRVDGGASEWLLRGAAALFEKLANLSDQYDFQAYFSQAEGRWLDLHAQGFEYSRRPDETDAELRTRMWSPPDVTMGGLNQALTVAHLKTGLRAALVELPISFSADFPAATHDSTLLAQMVAGGGAFCFSAGQSGADAFCSPVPPGVIIHAGPDATVEQLTAGIQAIDGAKAGGVASDIWLDPRF
jgi:hypothetical protein